MVTPRVGDLVHGLDVTGLEVCGTVTAVHSVTNGAGPYSAGPVVVLDVHDTPAPLITLVRTFEIKHHEPARPRPTVAE